MYCLLQGVIEENNDLLAAEGTSEGRLKDYPTKKKQKLLKHFGSSSEHGLSRHLTKAGWFIKNDEGLFVLLPKAKGGSAQCMEC